MTDTTTLARQRACDVAEIAVSIPHKPDMSSLLTSGEVLALMNASWDKGYRAAHNEIVDGIETELNKLGLPGDIR